MLDWILDVLTGRRADRVRRAERAYAVAIQEEHDALVARSARRADHPRPRLRTLDHPTDT